MYAETLRERPRVLRGRRLPPPPAVQRPRLQHLHPGRLQPRVEARARPRRHGGAGAAGHLRRRARPGRQADRHRAPTSRIGESGPIFEALGVLDTATPSRCGATSTPARTPRRGRRAAGAAARGDRAQGLRVQRARRRAQPALHLRRGRPRRHARPGFVRDPELYHQPTTRPGARLPHAWVGTTGRATASRPSTSRARAGSPSSPASAATAGPRPPRGASELGVEIATVVIGPGREYKDPYDDWARAREVQESGCVLVRRTRTWRGGAWRWSPTPAPSSPA